MAKKKAEQAVEEQQSGERPAKEAMISMDFKEVRLSCKREGCDTLILKDGMTVASFVEAAQAYRERHEDHLYVGTLWGGSDI